MSGYEYAKAKVAKLEAEKAELWKTIDEQKSTISKLNAELHNANVDISEEKKKSALYWKKMGLIRQWLFINYDGRRSGI